ncbi:PREDICTED: uncharacterized protein LOC105314282 [Amphimedon queenslandica]|uniref:AIG1-type G domain-containing protein n=1 Tax=Amphimedon queenslandica TaxID=400682 RepID=A0A1X7TWR9_AMPQE|nr:PREDICTED: uncharacterized protein LOC105314282 [Amphimedon queenslandica]|eukprot:XP_011406668.1 PREDICTED: uncharacterized protein LOC105314282 [Amphimedon queenslandica]
MSVLLIGSTGMGKSTLGNFLLNPDDKHLFNKQTFPSATTNRPMTEEVKVVSKRVRIEASKSEMLTIIDTPGYIKNGEKDLLHIINIIRKLNECGEIKACILVIKFSSKIDAQCKATMKHYSRLLPDLFDKNVIIVMTEFYTDTRSEALRKRQCIDVEQVKRNTIIELTKYSNNQISYSPQLFTIDCLPMTSAEKETSLIERKAILNYVFQLPPIRIKIQKIPKPDYIIHKDAQENDKLQGQIKGYSERLKEFYKTSKEALEDAHKKEREFNEIESKINNLETNLRDKNTTEDVVASQWSFNGGWIRSRLMTRDFNVKSPHKITNYSMNGNCEFNDVVQTSYTVSGRVQGKFSRRINASVIAYTEKRIKYADEIEDSKRRLSIENTNLTQCKSACEDFHKIHEESETEIKLLEQQIDEIRATAARFQSDFMTLDEAMSKLKS